MASNNWAEGEDEQVEVNQRALIDKVLARYAAEFTVFRELLQNSDDARAERVEIRFETQAFLDRPEPSSDAAVEIQSTKAPDLKTLQVARWTLKNDGIVFRDEDWARLKKIADGNPDEDKIGAFGVGFYSLFSVTEEPLVFSGDRGMRFYFKDGGDQLLVRRLHASSPASEQEGQRPWTSFHMPLREPAVLPNAPDLVRFLSSGLVFMARLREVSVWLDQRCLARVTKVQGATQALTIPRSLKPSSPKGMMRAQGLSSTSVTISADVMNLVFALSSERPLPKPTVPLTTKPSTGLLSGFWSAFSSRATTPTPAVRHEPPVPEVPKVDPLGWTERTVGLTIFTADLECKVDKQLNVELMRATKKNPPARVKYELIYTGKTEYDASREADAKLTGSAGRVFEGLRADLDGSGAAKIFIGHATNQTTGIGGHMSSRFIPTVERESVDLVDRHVAIWNRELLHSGGLLARAAYEIELATVAQLWQGAGGPEAPDEVRDHLTERAVHALRFFTFKASTPSALVSSEMEQAFFACGPTSSLLLPSTLGPKLAKDVRLPDDQLTKFLPRLAVVPASVMEKATLMVEALQRQKVLRSIDLKDVLEQLRKEPLPQEQGEAFMRWWIGQAPNHATNSRLPQLRTDLFSAARIQVGNITIALSSIQTFVDARRTPGVHVPLGGPLPSTCLPPALATPFRGEDLKAAFGWRELGIAEWLAHIVDPVRSNLAPETDVRQDRVWADRVLQVLGKSWANVGKEEQEACAALLRDTPCVPTTAGTRKPGEAYFPSVSLFPDLPIVELENPKLGGVDKVLTALGVRKHVELQLVFDRMIKTGDWTVPDLVKYLVSVQSTLSEKEWKRLSNTAAFLAEGKAVPDSTTGRPARWTAGVLYEPTPALRELGLLVIDWGSTKWRSTSEEAKFLFKIGLRRHPPLDVVLGLAAGSDGTLRDKALRYFLDHFTKHYNTYKAADFAHIAFVPAMGGTLAKPTEVFANPDWTKLGFTVVEPEHKEAATSKMKIREHPPSAMLISALQTRGPKTQEDAKDWFEALAPRLSYFSDAELIQLSGMAIVPARNPKTGELSNVPPSRCYFLREDASTRVHSKLFASVDFGARANAFLAALGAKDTPSVDEVAHMLLRSPREFWTLADGRDAFLSELRGIAVNRRAVSAPVYNQLKRAPVLLGMRRKPRTNEKAPPGEEDEDFEFDYDLMRPDQLVIADDTNEWQLFGDEVFCCPQEDLLEELYEDLGVRRLSSLVKESYRMNRPMQGSKVAADIRALVLQRLPLFLHDHQHDSPRVTYSSMQNEQVFSVQAYAEVGVVKVLKFGTVHVQKQLEVSAVANYDGGGIFRGTIKLSVSARTQVDMFEVANALCRVLFKTPRKNDALLFSAILSTDIPSLKRRGYNVDRILRQQRAEREAAEEVSRSRHPQSTALVSNTSSSSEGMPGGFDTPAPPIPVASKPPSSLLPSALTYNSTRGSTPTLVDEPLADDASLLKGGRPNSMISQLNKLKTQFSKRGLSGPGLSPGAGTASTPDYTGQSRPAASTSGHVTPLTNINANIQNAIKACRPETRGLMRNREQMQTVKESLNEGYCDVSGKAGDLRHIGALGEIKVYAAPNVPDLEKLMETKKDVLARFVSIIRQLGSVYALPPTSLHVFYDVAGGLIAFNSSGSLFCNLRYYEAWHDADVIQGDMSTAFISWYFTLAHEIAHNLVQPHNSEHEFYFSAICEAHLLSLGRLLGSGAGGLVDVS